MSNLIIATHPLGYIHWTPFTATGLLHNSADYSRTIKPVDWDRRVAGTAHCSFEA